MGVDREVAACLQRKARTAERDDRQIWRTAGFPLLASIHWRCLCNRPRILPSQFCEMHNIHILRQSGEVWSLGCALHNVRREIREFYFTIYLIYYKKLISLRSQTEIWCNGSTTDFGSVCLGSNPGISTKADATVM